MENYLNKKIEITILRIVAMTSIFLCHWFDGHGILQEILDVGVPLFFWISSFLYAQKTISNHLFWYIKRYFKLSVPVWIMAGLFAVYGTIITGEFPLADFLSNVLNIGGLSWVFREINLGTYIPGTWFISVILLCYFLIIIWDVEIQILGSSSFVKYKWVRLFIWCLIWILGVCILNIQISYFVVFLFGYLCGKNPRIVCGKHFKCYLLLMLGSGVLRIIVKGFADGTPFYNLFIVQLQLFMFALWIIESVFLLSSCWHKLADKIVGSRVIRILEKNSLFIYLIHPFVFKCIRYLNLNVIFAFVSSCILTFLFSDIMRRFIELPRRFARKYAERKCFNTRNKLR